MRVTLLDLGVGNLHSLAKAFQRALPQASLETTSDGEAASRSDLCVLPGVGAFAPAAERLAPYRQLLRERAQAGGAIIGICLGMQLLFEESDEGEGLGLGVLRGRVTKLATARLPHMGFSLLHPKRAELVLPTSVYFAHSYACRPEDPSVVLAETSLEGDTFPAIVRKENCVGFQFHPEKSSHEGIELLASFTKGICS